MYRNDDRTKKRENQSNEKKKFKENTENIDTYQNGKQNNSPKTNLCDFCLGNMALGKCKECKEYVCNKCIPLHNTKENHYLSFFKGPSLDSRNKCTGKENNSPETELSIEVPYDPVS